METNRALFMVLIVALLAVDCSIADSKVNLSANNGLNPQLNDTNKANEKAKEVNKDLGSNSAGVNKDKESEGGQVNKSKNDIENDSKSQLGSQVTGSLEKGQVDSNKEIQGKKENENNKGNSSGRLETKESHNDKEENSSGALEPKELSQGKSNGGDSVIPLTPPRNEASRVEECDPSYKCTDEDNKLVACVRVPGNESPDFSLLIQNKGKGPLTVTVSAPDFVQLEKTKIQMQAKEDKKVKVSISKGGSGNLIVLKAGKGHCNLDIKDLISHYLVNELDNSQKSTYINFMSRTTIAVISFAALLILASGWMCISFRRKKHSGNVFKYQKVDMELPVSGVGKTESEMNDGWDDNWGDDWDDEEAPKTPSMPVTPSLSSKGLASRRLSKEGWKD